MLLWNYCQHQFEFYRHERLRWNLEFINHELYYRRLFTNRRYVTKKLLHNFDFFKDIPTAIIYAQMASKTKLCFELIQALKDAHFNCIQLWIPYLYHLPILEVITCNSFLNENNQESSDFEQRFSWTKKFNGSITLTFKENQIQRFFGRSNFWNPKNFFPWLRPGEIVR